MNTYCLSCKKDTKNIDPKLNQDVLFAIIKSPYSFHKDLVGLIVQD